MVSPTTEWKNALKKRAAGGDEVAIGKLAGHAANVRAAIKRRLDNMKKSAAEGDAAALAALNKYNAKQAEKQARRREKRVAMAKADEDAKRQAFYESMAEVPAWGK